MERNSTLLSTPLDIHVDNKLDMYVECHICIKPPIDPIATSCGHIFCWPCIYKWLQSGPKPCPICRTTLAKELSILALHGFGTSAKPTNNISNKNKATTSINVIPSRPPNPTWFIYPDLYRVMDETNIEDSSQDTMNWLFHQLCKERDLRSNLIRHKFQMEQRIFDLMHEAQVNAMQHWEEMNQMAQILVKLQVQLTQANGRLALANGQLPQVNDLLPFGWGNGL